MKNLVMLAALAVLAPRVGAEVWTTVYRCDGVTPLSPIDPNHPTTYGDVMVGTRLVIVISSDKGEYWWGGLLVLQADAQRGTVSARGNYALPKGYKDSCLPAAGETARAVPHVESSRVGIDLNTSHTLPVLPGAWFVVDYHVQQIGTCHVGVYNYLAPNYSMPFATLSFTHVPTRDFKGDTAVDFKDFALVGSHWGPSVEPNSPVAAFDLNGDGRVDLADLVLFSEHWLERTDCANASE